MQLLTSLTGQIKAFIEK
ncbi:uncharacterized protein FFNC_09082 [Fusarium fujikuroi]|nr:uncharacterized protein FFNC_09082 [Fusarium fujikuroi]